MCRMELLKEIAGLEQELNGVQAPVIRKINVLLRGYESRSFETKDEAVGHIDAIKRLVRRAGCHLFYNGKPVTIQCMGSLPRKHPSIQVRGRLNGRLAVLRDVINMPLLEAKPLS